VIHNDGNRLYAALLLGAGLAVTLVAALTAWAAHLGGAAWPPVLVPFAAVLAVPMTALAWPRHADGNDRTNDAEASVGGGNEPVPHPAKDRVAPTTGTAA
jgi:hypothetical protein